MLYENAIWVGTGNRPICLYPEMADHHGLIVGATGTGKTVTAKVLAEGFSLLGIPVAITDIKGDYSGMAQHGDHSDKMAERMARCGVRSFCYRAFPSVFWDVYGEKGHSVRTVLEMIDPLLLGRMLGLNDTQTDVLDICFRVAHDEGMLILDFKDLSAILTYLGANVKNYGHRYGSLSISSIGVVQRALRALEDQGGARFFGEPALNMADWFMQDEEGYGHINILDCERLIWNPAMYSGLILWMLNDLLECLPDARESARPRLVFFIDEAHLLFSNCSARMLNLIELTIRLISSKGVGVFFISKEPSDIPAGILGLIGNRIAHALRVFTPSQQRALNAFSRGFRPNPSFDTRETVLTLEDGEALVSLLDRNGSPCIAERTTILPPQSCMKAIPDDLRRKVIEHSPFAGLYDEPFTRDFVTFDFLQHQKQEKK